MNEELLAYLVMGLGVMVTLLCTWSAFRPDSMQDWIGRLWGRPWSLPLAAVIRLLLGAALVSAAPASRAPLALTIIGWLAIAGAVLVIVAGRKGMSRIIDWVAGWPPALTRLWSVLGIAFGAFLVWSVL